MRVDIRAVHRPSASDLKTGRASFVTVNEPSIGIVADQVLLTGNKYAARSLDRGATWSPIDPYSYLFPDPPTDFCCDQTVYYDAAHDLIFWLLQYEESVRGNTLRVAVKQGATLDDDDWVWWDLTPAMLDVAWTGEWFDYNHASATDSHLFIGSNVYARNDDSLFRSVVVRISFQSIVQWMATGRPLDLEFIEDRTCGTLRCVTGAAGTMYIAGQVGLDTIRLYRWSDASASATSVEIAVSPWNYRAYSAPGPDGSNWISRCDDRITGGWVADGKIGFMWTSGRLNAERPYPYIRVVLLDEVTNSVVMEPDLWRADVAYAWPSVAVNARGEVGVTLFRGGGGTHPGHVVGGFDATVPEWILSVAVDGTNGPIDWTWGDYITCCSAGETWLAAGFTLQGGSTFASVVPHVVEFALV